MNQYPSTFVGGYSTRKCLGFVWSFIVKIAYCLHQVYFNNTVSIRVLGCQGVSRVRCYFTIALCVREKFSASYKDIEDEKFNEVVKYINFLKENPS